VHWGGGLLLRLWHGLRLKITLHLRRRCWQPVFRAGAELGPFSSGAAGWGDLIWLRRHLANAALLLCLSPTHTHKAGRQDLQLRTTRAPNPQKTLTCSLPWPPSPLQHSHLSNPLKTL
jgi:hypothetical protein